MTRTSPARISTKALVLAGLAVAALLVVFASGFASASPDGLIRTAQDQGFDSSAKTSDAASGPLAGYQARGVENAGISKAVSGLVGCAAVLLVGTVVVRVVRRRRPSHET